MRQRTDERWINSLICCYRPQARCTGEMSKRRKSAHENGEGRTRANRKRGGREREGWETERIRDPVGGGMKGWRWRDKHGNKKRGDKSLLLFICAQARLFLSFLACLSVCAHCQFFFFCGALICVPFLPLSTLALPSFVHTSFLASSY